MSRASSSTGVRLGGPRRARRPPIAEPTPRSAHPPRLRVRSRRRGVRSRTSSRSGDSPSTLPSPHSTTVTESSSGRVEVEVVDLAARRRAGRRRRARAPGPAPGRGCTRAMTNVGDVTGPRTPSPAPSPCVSVVLPAPSGPGQQHEVAGAQQRRRAAGRAPASPAPSATSSSTAGHQDRSIEQPRSASSAATSRGRRAAPRAAHRAGRTAAPPTGGRSRPAATAVDLVHPAAQRRRSERPGRRTTRPPCRRAPRRAPGRPARAAARSHGRQDATSVRRGLRLPGGRHLSTLTTATSARSRPASASSASSSCPERPTNGSPASSSWAPGRLADEQQPGPGGAYPGHDLGAGRHELGAGACSHGPRRPAPSQLGAPRATDGRLHRPSARSTSAVAAVRVTSSGYSSITMWPQSSTDHQLGARAAPRRSRRLCSAGVIRSCSRRPRPASCDASAGPAAPTPCRGRRTPGGSRDDLDRRPGVHLPRRSPPPPAGRRRRRSRAGSARTRGRCRSAGPARRAAAPGPARRRRPAQPGAAAAPPRPGTPSVTSASRPALVDISPTPDDPVAEQLRALVGQRHQRHAAHRVPDQHDRRPCGDGGLEHRRRSGAQPVDVDRTRLAAAGPAVAALVPVDAADRGRDRASRW